MYEIINRIEMDSLLSQAIEKNISNRDVDLNAHIQSLERKLDKPLSATKKLIADIAYPRTEREAKKINEEHARVANDWFSRFFPPTFGRMLDDLLLDPKGYMEKIKEYEFICLCPEIDFVSETREFADSVKDPMGKMEEARVERALLSLLKTTSIRKGNKLVALDLGSGSGRIARRIEQVLQGIFPEDSADFAVLGVDILSSNIDGARIVAKKNGSKIRFIKGDINRLHFETNKISFISSVATSYLNPSYKRPLEFAEIARVLREKDGVACIVNPNEAFSVKEYGYIMMRTAFNRYINPLNIAVMRKLGCRVLYTERLGKARLDMRLPNGSEIMDAVQKVLKSEILEYYRWPKNKNPDLWNAHTFMTNRKTTEVLQKYIDYLSEEETRVYEKAVQIR
jgi:SAM-dependent methyltransferase